MSSTLLPDKPVPIYSIIDKSKKQQLYSQVIKPKKKMANLTNINISLTNHVPASLNNNTHYKVPKLQNSMKQSVAVGGARPKVRTEPTNNNQNMIDNDPNYETVMYGSARNSVNNNSVFNHVPPAVPNDRQNSRQNNRQPEPNRPTKMWRQNEHIYQDINEVEKTDNTYL